MDDELCECGDLPKEDCMCDEFDEDFEREAEAWVNEGRFPGGFTSGIYPA